ncbi:hypothetical protein AB0K12_02335 [Nonomuraea sp. NPDC049419]|uniref:hypothetical protein n=1 Tax=Nonomuraea sp. NPDC049419 TaxID=3155772 RepID=UPI00342F36D8
MRRTAMVIALLLAAGCGTADPPYRPQEAAQPAPARSAASAEPETDPPESAPAPSPAAVPTGTQTVEVGEAMWVRVEWPARPDPLVKTMVDYYLGVRRAIAEGASGYGHNLEYEAEVSISDWIRAFTDEGETIRGTARLYNLRVAAVYGKGAQINACIDERDVKVVSADTGKPIPNQPRWMRSPYPQSVLAHRGDDGVWRIRSRARVEERCTR